MVKKQQSVLWMCICSPRPMPGPVHAKDPALNAPTSARRQGRLWLAQVLAHSSTANKIGAGI